MDIRMTKLYSESWNIAYRKTNTGMILKDQSIPFKVVPNPWRYWIADPMIFEYKDRTFVFAECFDYIRNRGIIGYSEYINDSFGKWHPVIVSSGHLSYPFIFSYQGDIYCIPESSQDKKLLLYKAIEFPDKWNLQKVICENEKFVDTTISKIDEEKMYAYTNLLDGAGGYCLLFDKNFNIVGKHEIPGSRDHMHRCAEPVFYNEGFLFRVTQDCRNDYGSAIIFRKCDSDLTELSTTMITPEMIKLDRKMLVRGIHTYSSTEKMEIIDIRTRRFNILNLISKTIHFLVKRIL